MYGFLNLSADIFGSKSELIGNEVDCLSVKTLVDTYHDAYRHQCTDELSHWYVHHRGEFGNGHELCKFQCLALQFCVECILLALLCCGITFLLTILGALLCL